jgi:hypothetical protein
MKPKEPAANLRYYCREHAPAPDTSLHARPAASFVGTWVKRASASSTVAAPEHMWVKVQRVTADGQLVGTLDSIPTHVGPETCSRIGAGARAGMVEQCSSLSIDAEHR